MSESAIINYVSLLVGAIIGFIGSIGFFFVQVFWNFRNAAKLLKAEISLTLSVIDSIIPSLRDAQTQDDPSAISAIPSPEIDTQFYQKAIEHITLFKVERMLDIKKFYFLIDVYQHDIERAVDSKGDPQVASEWLKKAVGALSLAKDIGERLSKEL